MFADTRYEANDLIWQERRSQGEDLTKKNKLFDVYQRDRARIIHSGSFRRLQAKTQVLEPRKGDRHRTRLTHSLEVAQIGSGLISYLKSSEYEDSNYGQLVKKWLPSMFLIEGICLAHDLGHSPFGHGGEVALNFVMKDHGGFESNAQTLRLLCHLGNYHKDFGFDLSRRMLLGVLKYPAVYSNLCTYSKVAISQSRKKLLEEIAEFKPPKCIYDSDEQILDWLIHPFSKKDCEKFGTIRFRDGKKITVNRTFDNSIMDLADDIGYGIHDLEDAIALGIIKRDVWNLDILSSPLVVEHLATSKGKDSEVVWEELTDLLFDKHSHNRKRAISQLVAWVMQAVSVKIDPDFDHPLLGLNAYLTGAQAKFLVMLKDFTYRHYISLPENKTKELEGQSIIFDLFHAFKSQPERFLPEKKIISFQLTKNEASKMRLICDHIAGMTNDYAIAIHSKICSSK